MKQLWFTVATSLVIFGCKTSGKNSQLQSTPSSWFQVYEPLPREQLDAARAKFIERNGSDWDATYLRFDEFSAIPYSGVRMLAAEAAGSSASMEGTARDFLHRNRDAFRIQADEIDRLIVTTDGEVGNRIVLRSNQPEPYLGFESMQNFTYRLHFEFFFAKGMLLSFVNRSNLLPQPIYVTKTPTIKADDPRIHEAVLGEKFKYNNFAGQEIETPPVIADYIQSTELIIAARRLDDQKLWVGLVYSVRIQIGELWWTAFVSSENGRLEWLQQDFFT